MKRGRQAAVEQFGYPGFRASCGVDSFDTSALRAVQEPARDGLTIETAEIHQFPCIMKT